MFKIEKDTGDSFTKIKIINTLTREYISIVPEFGGNINEIVLSKNKFNYSILDGYKTNSELVINKGFKGVKLLPFPNRIKDGNYKFAGKSYQLPVNKFIGNHAIHGFFYNKTLNVSKNTIKDNYASVSLEYLFDDNIKGYPFKFTAEITYFLFKEKGFKCTTEIMNNDNCAIPIGDGWHPYFTMNKKVNNLMLTIPARSIVEVDGRMIPTGKILPYRNSNKSFKIGKTNFDTAFMLEKKDGNTSTEIYDSEQDLRIQCWQETGKWKYNYLQVYIPPSRLSIAIEPMTCNINAFNNKEGLIILQPGQLFRASYGVRVL